uniref:Putative secreted protein n=1 Tax=Anopheles marajoara TaxID=58244 RepID=A0A2M4C784_9DIPT
MSSRSAALVRCYLWPLLPSPLVATVDPHHHHRSGREARVRFSFPVSRRPATLVPPCRPCSFLYRHPLSRPFAPRASSHDYRFSPNQSKVIPSVSRPCPVLRPPRGTLPNCHAACRCQHRFQRY